MLNINKHSSDRGLVSKFTGYRMMRVVVQHLLRLAIHFWIQFLTPTLALC